MNTELFMKRLEGWHAENSTVRFAQPVTDGVLPMPARELTGLPPFIRVAFVSVPGENSFIQNEVWLPLQWNGIFIGLGNGGMAGGLSQETMAVYLRGGFAVAHTDMGTSRGRGSGVHSPDVWADFGWRDT